jgi:hypothetical protein
MAAKGENPSLVAILTVPPDSGIIQRIRMMLEDALFRCMASPSEKQLLIHI